MDHNQMTIKAKFFDSARFRLTRLAERLVPDASVVVDEASAIFDRMLPDLAYQEKPDHPLAAALFTCSVNIALYLAVKSRGVDVHAFGASLLAGLTRAPIPVPELTDDAIRNQIAWFTEAGAASRQEGRSGEDVFEAVLPEAGEFEWGFNITSCSIRHEAAKHDALELVPYLCAVDDVMSDKGNQGLRRTGSIALGAQQCDFRYKRGGEPLRLAEQYPERIRFRAE